MKKGAFIEKGALLLGSLVAKKSPISMAQHQLWQKKSPILMAQNEMALSLKGVLQTE